MKAMLFAAGLGTRLKPFTDTRPKALIEIGGMTLLERCINQLRQNGIRELVINIHHFARQIENYLSRHHNFGLVIHISDERDQLLNTGGGILKAKDFLLGEEPVLLVNVDILTNLNFGQVLDFHLASQSLATLVVRQRSTSRYLLFNHNQLAGWKNHQTGEVKISRPDLIETAEEYAFSGIHLIQPQLLDRITESGKFSIIELYLRLARTEKIGAFIDRQSVWMDLGKTEDLPRAEKLIQQLKS